MKLYCDPKTLLTETALVERFLTYVAVDTQSNEAASCSPSTDGQLVLARQLVEELVAMGIGDAAVDENGYVTATVPGDDSKGTVGLIAHLDTSPAVSGAGVAPMLHADYDGGDLTLSNGDIISAVENPELSKYLGDTIITSDGATLLGADDKAGVAVIMAAAAYWMRHPEAPRPKVRIGFTPDEEIGRGSRRFPMERFGADIAYTLDGSFAGEINIETFEAVSAKVTFDGVSAHPGQAKGKLVNALKWMARFIESLPVDESPETTVDREGFIHPVSVGGDATQCRIELILRDFDPANIRLQQATLETILKTLEAAEPRLRTTLETSATYPNMGVFLKDRPEILARLEAAVRETGLTPAVIPIRGGTDGSVLTGKGLLCPNIFAGGMNFHETREWVADRAMALSLCTVLNLMAEHAR
jgi:tripeptide aminopeptidase